MVDPDSALILVNLMLNCAKSGSNLPILVVKKGRKDKPDKVLKAEIFCPQALKEAYSRNEYNSTNSGIHYETWKFVQATLCYHNLKPVPSYYTNDSRNEFLKTYYQVYGCKTNKRAQGVKSHQFLNVAQIEIPDTAKILYGRGNA